jgi:uncharacterized RDD family membrane protein YckC
MNTTAVYAGFWRRAAANFLDALVLMFPTSIVAMGFGGDLLLILNLVVSLLYFALMHSSPLQASFGKIAFKIKVTGCAGERIGFGRAAIRFPAAILSAALLCIGLIMAGLTARKQALHDMLCGTLVVSSAATPAEIVAGGDTMPVTGGVKATIAVMVLLPPTLSLLGLMGMH